MLLEMLCLQVPVKGELTFFLSNLDNRRKQHLLAVDIEQNSTDT